MDEKVCTKCLKKKPVGQFGWQNKTTGKQLGPCKGCIKKRDVLLHHSASRPKRWNKK